MIGDSFDNCLKNFSERSRIHDSWNDAAVKVSMWWSNEGLRSYDKIRRNLQGTKISSKLERKFMSCCNYGADVSEGQAFHATRTCNAENTFIFIWPLRPQISFRTVSGRLFRFVKTGYWTDHFPVIIWRSSNTVLQKYWNKMHQIWHTDITFRIQQNYLWP